MLKEEWENLEVGDTVSFKGNICKHRKIIRISKNNENKTKTISLEAIKKTKFCNKFVTYAINDRSNWVLVNKKIDSSEIKILDTIVTQIPKVKKFEANVWSLDQAIEAFHHGALVVNCAIISQMKIVKVTSIKDAEIVFTEKQNLENKGNFKNKISELFPLKIIVDKKNYKCFSDILSNGSYIIAYGFINDEDVFNWNDKLFQIELKSEQECIETAWKQLSRILEQDFKRKTIKQVLCSLTKKEYKLIEEYFKNDKSAKIEVKKEEICEE